MAMSGVVHEGRSRATSPRPEAVAILVVEDDALVASYIRDVLEESGFIVPGVASTGAEAFALVVEMKPRLALVDIRLAGPLDGIEVARQLLTRFNVPSIFLSGIDDPEILERAEQTHPLGFLRKPFRPSQVFNALERALNIDLRP
jgi:two-component system, response regulator PdtaR